MNERSHRFVFTLAAPLAISLVWPLSAAAAQQSASSHPATPQRPTFTTDTSVTTPGTVELELGGFFAENLGALPTSVKFTPDVSGLFHRTEIAVSFDALSSVSTRGDRDTRFGDTLTVAVRRALYESDGFSFALAPVATFFLRGEDGARLGGAAIAAYGRGANSIVVNLGLTGATSSSVSNPSVQLDFATDFSRSLSERFTIFAGALLETASESAGAFSLDQGLTFRVRPDVVLDIAVVERGLADGPSALELLLGLTVNLGWPVGGFRGAARLELSTEPFEPSRRRHPLETKA